MRSSNYICTIICLAYVLNLHQCNPILVTKIVRSRDEIALGDTGRVVVLTWIASIRASLFGGVQDFERLGILV